jgi:copper chaperone NosL
MQRSFLPTRRTVVAGLVAFTCTGVQAASISLPKPGPRDVCPVCGMFVAPYRYWTATILFKDGQAVHFDGAKDLYKYLTDIKRWGAGRSDGDIATIGVTAYYDTELIDARTAVYVIGSDVLGPMGHELVPHDSRADAEEFLRDHKGSRIVTPTEISPALLAGLDEGRFE